jgi:hypothetical protein
LSSRKLITVWWLVVDERKKKMLNEYLTNPLNAAEGPWGTVRPNRKSIICNDGLTLSVQASRFHYCCPRDDNGPWTNVEVGFPSEKCEELMEWAETPEDPTGTVYGYVPIEVVEGLIEKHGGMKVEKKEVLHFSSLQEQLEYYVKKCEDRKE